MNNLIPLRDAGIREKEWAKSIAEEEGEFDSEEELSDVLDTALPMIHLGMKLSSCIKQCLFPFPKSIDREEKTMKKFSVYENGKPCNRIGFPILKGNDWKNHSFDTFEAAQEYANDWLGDYATPLTVNVPYEYSGYGDMIEIREEEVEE
jgi:hypothetical protein